MSEEKKIITPQPDKHQGAEKPLHDDCIRKESYRPISDDTDDNNPPSEDSDSE